MGKKWLKLPEVRFAGKFKAHFHWTEKLGTGLIAILQASDWKQRVEHTGLNKLVCVRQQIFIW